MPICLKRRVCDQWFFPVLTYGSETLTATIRTINNIQVAQQAMERSMLGVLLRDRFSNAEIRISGIANGIRRITTLKWNIVGHIANTSQDRRKILAWRPRQETFRN